MSSAPLSKQPQPAVAHHPAIGDIRDLLTFRVAMFAAASDRVGQRWLADEFDLRIMEWRVVGVVAALQPVRFSEVSRTLLIDKGQLSRLVANLTARGLLSSSPDPEDQRTMRLSLTTDGRSLHDRALARAFARNERIVATLDPDELATLFKLLDRLQPYMAHRAEPADDGE